MSFSEESKGRRPKTPEEKEQDRVTAQQAVKDLYELKEHYGSWINITRRWGVHKASLSNAHKLKGKGVMNSFTLAFIKAALTVIKQEKEIQDLKKVCAVYQAQILHLAKRCKELE